MCTYKLDGDCLWIEQICAYTYSISTGTSLAEHIYTLTLKDDAKRAFSNLLANLVVDADDVARAGRVVSRGGEMAAGVGRADDVCGSHAGDECGRC